MDQTPPIVFLCSGCKSKLRAPRSAAGKKIRCSKCGKVGTAPVPEPEPILAEAIEEDFDEPPRSRNLRRQEESYGDRRPSARGAQARRDNDRLAPAMLGVRTGAVTAIVVFHFI